MSKPINIEVPFVTIGNRRGLTIRQLKKEPWLEEFVQRFPLGFEYDPLREVYLLIEDATPPEDNT